MENMHFALSAVFGPQTWLSWFLVLSKKWTASRELWCALKLTLDLGVSCIAQKRSQALLGWDGNLLVRDSGENEIHKVLETVEGKWKTNANPRRCSNHSVAGSGDKCNCAAFQKKQEPSLPQ